MVALDAGAAASCVAAGVQGGNSGCIYPPPYLESISMMW
jgi:hypothetical protein